MPYIGNTNTTQAFTPAVDFFNGNGSTTAFTLSRPVASVAQVQAVIENVPQNPGDAFTVSGNTITFTSAPPSGTSNIYVYYTSPITQVIAPSDGTVGAGALATGAVTTSKIADANVTAAKLASGAARSNFGAGAVVQVQNTYGSSTISISNSGSGRVYSDLLTIAFTPVSASNKIVVIGTSGQTSFSNRSANGAFGIVFDINNTVYDFGNYPWYNGTVMYPVYPPDITITRSLNVPTGSTFNIKLRGYSYNESVGNITSNFISYQLTVLEVAV